MLLRGVRGECSNLELPQDRPRGAECSTLAGGRMVPRRSSCFKRDKPSPFGASPCRDCRLSSGGRAGQVVARSAYTRPAPACARKAVIRARRRFRGGWAGHVREKAAEALIGPLVAVSMAWVGVASRVPAQRLERPSPEAVQAPNRLRRGRGHRSGSGKKEKSTSAVVAKEHGSRT